MAHTPESILADLTCILQNFQGREYSGEIDRSTRCFGDLGLVSIDAVVLNETLAQKYGRRLPFHLLLAELQARHAEDLKVGELVDFLTGQLTA